MNAMTWHTSERIVKKMIRYILYFKKLEENENITVNRYIEIYVLGKDGLNKKFNIKTDKLSRTEKLSALSWAIKVFLVKQSYVLIRWL